MRILRGVVDYASEGLLHKITVDGSANPDAVVIVVFQLYVAEFHT